MNTSFSFWWYKVLFVGTVTIGNPDGANVPALKSFLVEDDLKRVFANM